MEWVEIEGLSIAFERSGAGPPVLLLHGGLSDSREWKRQIEVLSDDFTVVAWDAPGCGRSSDPPESFRMPDYADCLSSLVNTLGLRQPHVIGLSFGGTLALELYRRHSTVPRSLLIASAYAGWAGSLSPDVAPSDWREFSSSPNCLPSRVDFELAILSPPLERLSKPLLPLSGSYVQVDLVHTVPFEAKRSEQRPPPAEEKPDDETNYRDDDPNHPFGSWFRLVL